MSRYANYQYSLTGAQQQAIQLWLRGLPREIRETRGNAWVLLHELTYTNDWSDEPKFMTATIEETEQ